MNICTVSFMDTPYGPHKLTGKRQLALPKELADKLRLEVGDRIYFLENPDLPGTILVIPIELMSTWIARGRAVSTHGAMDTNAAVGEDDR
jgi:hypothetical protein